MKNTEILLTIKLQQALLSIQNEFVYSKKFNNAVRLIKQRKCKVSYKSAWDHLEAMNKISPRPLLERNTGGKKWRRHGAYHLCRAFAPAL